MGSTTRQPLKSWDGLEQPMTTILRVVGSDGKGVYRSPTTDDVLLGLIRPEHPHPSEDPVLCDAWVEIAKRAGGTRSWFYGFADRAQYERWFDADLRAKLATVGCVLQTIEVPEHCVRRGEAQVMFVAAHAAIVHEEPVQ